MSTTTTTTTTSEGALVLPSHEWLEYFFQQQIMEDFDVPFISGDAVSEDTSFGDDVVFLPGPGATSADDFVVTPPGSSKVSRDDHVVDENMLVHNVSGSGGAAPATAARVFGSPENSSAASNVDLSPKSTMAKQVRRRSRASRRTPTTLLNASIKNFRTLVQQYTGCQSAASGFSRSGKGPITLSFGAPNQRNDFPASFAGSFDGNYCYYTQESDQYHMNQQQI